MLNSEIAEQQQKNSFYKKDEKKARVPAPKYRSY